MRSIPHPVLFGKVAVGGVAVAGSRTAEDGVHSGCGFDAREEESMECLVVKGVESLGRQIIRIKNVWNAVAPEESHDDFFKCRPQEFVAGVGERGARRKELLNGLV
jgi:hypothetical protein